MIRGVIVYVAVAVLSVAFAGPTAILILLVPRWSDLSMRVGKVWSRSILAIVGARVVYRGRENLEARLPCIYLVNHQSSVDIWVLIAALPLSARFVAKQELFRIPVFGWVLSAAGFVPINRANRAEAIRSLDVAAERVRGGTSLVLFPEGSRSRHGRLDPFKKGAFHLALQARVPVVPITIRNSFHVMPPGSLRVRPGPVYVTVDPPIDVTPFLPDDHAGLLRVVRDVIERRFHEPMPDEGEPAVGFGTP
jgi:1-acyl-sn-glycerol-3-phosphate acyltransferase